jgi:hypothetical protein
MKKILIVISILLSCLWSQISFAANAGTNWNNNTASHTDLSTSAQAKYNGTLSQDQVRTIQNEWNNKNPDDPIVVDGLM